MLTKKIIRSIYTTRICGRSDRNFEHVERLFINGKPETDQEYMKRTGRRIVGGIPESNQNFHKRKVFFNHFLMEKSILI
jgi:hypothetical protein